ncbi:MAG TPA: DUF11 domain-containing protein, partial [Thermoanaerobaculia bacterium]|nr:DUF11 domain-containing protein [Thermoanaerobaculia bacterium]
ITKSASPASPVYPLAFDVTFTLTATNAGPNTANAVTVTDTLPTNMAFVSANASQGTCSGTTTVTCSVGTLAVNGTATITIVARTANVGNASNTATISSASADSNPANNTSTVAFVISADIPALSPLFLLLLAAALAAIALRRA